MLVYTNSMKTETSSAYYLRMFDEGLHSALRRDDCLTAAMWGVKRVYAYWSDLEGDYFHYSGHYSSEIGEVVVWEVLWMGRLTPVMEFGELVSKILPSPVLLLGAPCPIPVRDLSGCYSALVDHFHDDYKINVETFGLEERSSKDDWEVV